MKFELKNQFFWRNQNKNDADVCGISRTSLGVQEQTSGVEYVVFVCVCLFLHSKSAVIHDPNHACVKSSESGTTAQVKNRKSGHVIF